MHGGVSPEDPRLIGRVIRGAKPLLSLSCPSIWLHNRTVVRVGASGEERGVWGHVDIPRLPSRVVR